jgi:hypothetical protein
MDRKKTGTGGRTALPGNRTAPLKPKPGLSGPPVPLANGRTALLPSQTIVKEDGRVLVRGTRAPSTCKGQEYVQ